MRGPQEIIQPERLWQPAAPGLREEPFGVGSCDVAGDEDHVPGQRRVALAQHSVERRAIEPWHFQVADHQVEDRVGNSLQGVFPIGRALHTISGVSQRLADRGGERWFILDDKHGGA